MYPSTAGCFSATIGYVVLTPNSCFNDHNVSQQCIVCVYFCCGNHCMYKLTIKLCSATLGYVELSRVHTQIMLQKSNICVHFKYYKVSA